MNKIKQYMTILIFSIISNGSLLAHSDVIKTIPKNGAILDKAPQTISIYMTKKIRLVKVHIRDQNDKMIKVNTAQYKGFANNFTLPIPTIENGIYKVNWRAIAQDGHIMKGHFNFTVME